MGCLRGLAAQLPPLGCRVYRFASGLPAAASPAALRATATELENDRLLLRLDPSTGAIVACVDKATGLDLVGAGGWNVAQVLEDKTDTWSHRVPGYSGPPLGEFRDATITVMDAGPLQASLLVARVDGASHWLQQIVLRRGSDDILIRNWLTWQGQWRIVKLAFDVAVDAPQAVHDVPFGWCARPVNGAEVPTQMWMDVSGLARRTPGQVAGAALINDGKYACDVTGSVMRLTILRCPPYAHHDPHPFGSKRRYEWVDQGYQEFTLVVCPHVGDWRDAHVVETARALNLPVVPITMHSHPGSLPGQASLLALSSPDMELAALKAAEDGDGWIARIVDRHGRGGDGGLTWQGATFPLTLAPFEVATLRLTLTGPRCVATGMLERGQA